MNFNDRSEQYVSEFTRLERLKAEHAFLKKETRRLQQVLTSPGALHLFDDTNLLGRDAGLGQENHEALAVLLEENSKPYVKALQNAQHLIEADVATTLSRWKSDRKQLGEKQQALFDERATTKVQGKIATLLSVDNKWFWVSFAISISGLAIVVLHERRHAMRRWFNGGRAQALGLSTVLGVLLILVFFLLISFGLFGDRLYQQLIKIGIGEDVQVLEEEKQLEEMRQQLQELQTTTDELKPGYEKAVQAVVTRLREDQVALPLVTQWQENRRKTKTIMIDLDVEAAIAEKLSSDEDVLKQLEPQLQQEIARASSFSRKKNMIRFALGFFLLLVTSGGGWMFQKGVRKRMKQRRATCPLCLEESFTSVPLRDTSQEQRLCTNELDDGDCRFENKDAFRDLKKLCLATLGHPASGKTFWLSLCYRQARLGEGVPDFVHFQRQSNKGTEKLNEILRYILEERMDPEATDPGLMPRPVLFDFRDRDPWGASQELLSIFDFSGEITATERLEGSPQRQRALMADGFFYFLDPTLPGDAQVESLERFREDLKELMKLRAGDQVRTPVALCISKIDLLGNMPYADPKGAVGKFYEDLAEIGHGVSMAKIRRRSEAVKELLPFIWPDWKIEREIKNFFGGRIMFFPMTPVGLGRPFHNDFDSIDDRDIRPYLIMEPMLWLVHMTGHLVLDEMPLLSRIADKVVGRAGRT